MIQKGELDLRTLPLMLKGGKAGPAVVAGKPEESELWLAIAENDMPKEKPPLSAKDKATLKAWIAAGLPTGDGDRGVPLADLVLAPFAILGAWLGVRAHMLVPERLFFGLTYVLLVCTGSKLIWDTLT